jgi:hypothetical protein
MKPEEEEDFHHERAEKFVIFALFVVESSLAALLFRTGSSRFASRKGGEEKDSSLQQNDGRPLGMSRA